VAVAWQAASLVQVMQLELAVVAAQRPDLHYVFPVAPEHVCVEHLRVVMLHSWVIVHIASATV